MHNLIPNNKNLLQSIISVIDKTRRNVAIAVNSELTVLYWHIGKQINESILQNNNPEPHPVGMHSSVEKQYPHKQQHSVGM
jgi:hypothetical protein